MHELKDGLFLKFSQNAEDIGDSKYNNIGVCRSDRAFLSPFFEQSNTVGGYWCLPLPVDRAQA